MANKLVIVESPAKAKTIGKYLGARLHRASLDGARARPAQEHARASMSTHDFAPKYLVPRDKNATVKELQGAASRTRRDDLPGDRPRPRGRGDRLAPGRGDRRRRGKPVQRVVFHEITRDAVSEAMEHPRADRHATWSTPSRRGACSTAWSATRSARCSGRRSSAGSRPGACSRSRCGWSSSASARSRPSCRASTGRSRRDWRKRGRQRPRPARIRGRAARASSGEKAELPDARRTGDARAGGAGGRASIAVAEVRQRETQRRPAAPFTTSTLQQEASRKLGLPVRRTMPIAQELYEGVDLGGEHRGPHHLHADRLDQRRAGRRRQAARELIAGRCGGGLRAGDADRLPDARRRARRRRTRRSGRPTRAATRTASRPISRRPQFRLYHLIWQRFVACQMARRCSTARRSISARGTPGRRPEEPPTGLPGDRLGGQVPRLPGASTARGATTATTAWTRRRCRR